jgi:cytochrome c6
MPLALSSYQAGLLVVACTFIAFALVVAVVISRTRPEFPGKRLSAFIAAVIVLFAAEITAVLVLAANESPNEAAAGTVTTTTQTTTTQTTPAQTTPTQTTPTQTTPTQTTPTQTTPTQTTPTAGDPVAGRAIFLAQPCGNCHTLKDAGTTGTVGPNLDQLKPPYDKVVTQVTNGGAIMPPFKNQLTAQQIQDVAAYVSSVAGK